MTTKLCKDCLYYKRFWFDSELSECKSPERPHTVSLIDGTPYYTRGFCDSLRKDYTYVKTCGSEAKWFKPKTPFLKYFFTDK